MTRVSRAMPAVFLAAWGLSALRPIDDADFWWLLRAGRYMVETRSFPTTDPFSATAQGATWLNHAWGFELLIYGLYALWGTTGVILLQGITAAATGSVLYRLLRREGLGRGWSIGLLSIGALAMHGFWSPRPQLVTYFILALFVSVLADYQAGRRNRLWWLPLLTALWANLHAGFLSGPLLVALCAAGELGGWALGDDTGRAGGLARARVLAFWSALSVLASLANPFHYHALLFPFQVMGEELSQAWISEWASPPFSHPQVLVLELLLGLFLLLALGTALPIPWRDLVVLVPLVHLGLQATRNTPLLVIVATPILGRAAASCARAHWPRLGGLVRRAIAVGTAGLVLSACSMVAGSRRPAQVWSAFRPTFGVAESLPTGAAEFLRREGRRGTLWNEYVWGGFLIWHLYPELRVSIDGRMAVYGPARFSEHLAVSELTPGWQEVLARLDPTAAVVRSGAPLVSALRAAGWTVRYEDGVATVLEPPGAKRMKAERIPRGVLVAATLLGVATIALSSLTLFDFWWYLASGQRILQTHSIPKTDPFSYTAEGRPWVNHMWATQVLFTLLWEQWGRYALIGLKTATIVATFWVVLGTIRARGVHPLLASAVTLLAAWTGAEFWHARPQMFTYLFVAVLIWLLRPGWEHRRVLLALVPALVVPWVNLHAGFMMAFLVIGLIGLGTALPALVDPARRPAGWRVVGLTALLGLLAVVASLLNPFGARAILFPLEVVQSVPFMTSTIEWFPPNFHHRSFRALELMLLLLFPAFAWGRSRLGAADVALVLAFANLGLTSVRHVPLFAIVAAPILADALQAVLARTRRIDWEGIRAAVRRGLPSLAPALTAPGAPLVAGAALLVTAVSAHWAGMAQVPTNPLRLDLDEGRYPTRTMAFIRENRLPPRLFSVYAWGGYELFRLYPEYRTFMDGRTHVYGPEVLKEFLDVVNVSPRWQTVLDKWQVQTILALRGSPLTETLRAQGGWRLVFNEREAVVFVRETDANRPLLARLARQSRETVPGDQEETADRRPTPGPADPVVVTWVPAGTGRR